MFVGTQADNLRDMWSKGRGHDGTRAERGELRYNAKLTDDKVRKIRHLAASTSRSVASIAAEFEVDPANIRAIVRRRAWRHVA